MKFVKDGNILYYPVFEGMPKLDPLTGNSYIVWSLIPIATWDYTYADYDDRQGWLQEIDRDGEIVDNDSISLVQYYGTEGFEECVESSGLELERVSAFTQIDYRKDNPQPIEISDEEAVNVALL